jgi:fibro-slime domain-containing protein
MPLVYSFLATLATLAACTFNPGPPGSSSGPPPSAGAAGAPFYIPGAGNSGTVTGAGGGGVTTNNPGGAIPSDFTRAQVGAWKTGAAISATGAPPTIDSPDKGCYQILGVVRDFKGADEAGGHPDFEAYSGSKQTTGLVGTDLGADRKPVYASKCEKNMVDAAACPYGAQTTSAADFMPWYRTTDGVNKAFEIFFILEQSANGTAQTFSSSAFFPLDAAKVPDSFGNNGREHNFHFTTELHTKFMYRGGEKFTFRGDDDLWVFVNKKLALDLGGLHPMVEGTIDMDAQAGQLGLTKGTAYDLELFHAERHTNASNFQVETNFVFVDCGIVIP